MKNDVCATERIIRWSHLAWPVAAAAGIRLLLLLITLHATGLAAITAGDSISYLRPGAELMRHACFCSSGLPEIDRTPGYPLFAMLTGSLWGALFLTVMAQILLSALNVVLAHRITMEIFPDAGAAQAAAWLMALEPLAVEYSIRLLSETLFVFLLLLFLWRLVQYMQQPNMHNVAQAAVLLAAMAYVRPVAYWLALPIALVFPRRRWTHAVVFVALFSMLVAPWQMRNAHQARSTEFSSIADKNLYFYVAGAVLAQRSHVSLETWQADAGKEDAVLWAKLHPEQQSWTEAQRNAWLRSEGLQVLRAHPWSFLRSYISGEVRLLSSPGASEFFRLTGWSARPPGMDRPLSRRWSGLQWIVTGSMEAYLLLLWIFAAFALFAWRRRGKADRKLWLLAAVALYFLAVSGGGQAVSRLRLPVMPILCIFAGGGMALAGKYTKRDGDPGRI